LPQVGFGVVLGHMLQVLAGLWTCNLRFGSHAHRAVGLLKLGPEALVSASHFVAVRALA
jgi:hypothetical protein